MAEQRAWEQRNAAVKEATAAVRAIMESLPEDSMRQNVLAELGYCKACGAHRGHECDCWSGQRMALRKTIAGDEFTVLLRWDDPDGDHAPWPNWVDFEIVEAPEVNGERRYRSRKDGTYSTDPEDSERIINGFVKWDGCTQWWAECAHVDDESGQDALLAAVRIARAEAIDAMGKNYFHHPEFGQ
jgi:hypothetical protein